MLGLDKNVLKVLQGCLLKLLADGSLDVCHAETGSESQLDSGQALLAT